MDIERLIILAFVGVVIALALSLAASAVKASRRRALCNLIDAIDGEIMNDWSGEQMTKEEAKQYVMEYGA